MSATIICPRCQRRLLLPEECVGTSVQCPACHQQFEAGPAGGPAAALTSLSAPDDFAERIREDPRPSSRPQTVPPLGRRDARARVSSRSSPRRRWGWLILTGLILGGLGTWVSTIPWAGLAPKPLVRPRRPVVRDAGLPNVFVRDQKPLVPEGIAAEVKPLFDALGKALGDRDQARITSHFDFDRMFDELMAQEIIPNWMTRDRAGFVKGFRIGLGTSLTKRAALLTWAGSEIRNVKKLDANEVEVIVRHTTDDGRILKIRWWLTKRPGTWQVFDMEDLDVGLRTSAIVVSVGQIGPNNMQGIAQAVTKLGDAILDVQNQNVEAADQKVQAAARTQLPEKLEGFRHMVIGMVRLHQGKPQEALEAVDKAHAFHPSMPCLDLLKGVAFNNLGQWDKAQKHLQAYQDLLGDDPDICRELGLALQQLNRSQEAAAQYRKSLDYQPDQPDTFLGLLRSLGPGDNKDDIGARFAKLKDPHKNFDTCADDARQARDHEELEQLAAAMHQVDPAYAPAYFYQALAKAWGPQPEEALSLLRKGFRLEKEPAKQRELARPVLEALAAAGKASEAYAVAPDPREAFRCLADGVRKSYRQDELGDLISLHEKKHADDPALALYRAELFALEGEYEKADKAFSADLATPWDLATLAAFRSSRVLAKFHTGQSLAALVAISPRRETFGQLVGLCLGDRNYSLLQQLLDDEARADPDNPDLAVNWVRLKIRQGQLPDAVALFKKAVQSERGNERRKKLVDDFLYAMVDAGKSVEGYEAAPDPEQAFQVLAIDLWEQDRILRDKDLRALVEAHGKKRPQDSWLAYYQAQLYLQDEAWAKAADLLSKVRAQAPADARSRFEHAFVYAMYKAGRAREAYSAIPSKETFNDLAMHMVSDKKVADLEALLAAHRPRAAADPDFLNYAARAKILAKEFDQAVDLFQKAYQKQGQAGMRDQYVRTFLLDMVDAGNWLTAYRTVPDKRLALQTLAGQFLFQKKDQELEALLGELELNDAGPGPASAAWRDFYRGELHWLRHEFEQAEEAFTAAQAKAGKLEPWSFRNALFRARVKTGQTVRTYQEYKAARRTFEDLANACVADKNAEELTALLAAHRQAHPDFRHALAWELEVKWLKWDFAGVCQIVTKDAERLLTQPIFRWKAEDYLVRSLVQLKRTGEAVERAEAIVEKRNGSSLLLVLAHAASGDVKKAVAALEKAGQVDRYLLDSCYGDPDLGPLLRNEGFREFRERFPEKKVSTMGEDRPASGRQ